MGKQINLILAAVYIAVGIVSSFLLGIFAGDGFIGFILGLMIIVASFALHEFMMRRDGFRRVLRGVAGLRSKVDKIEQGIDGMQKDVGKASADARGANSAAAQFQEIQALVQKTAQEFAAFKKGGGAANGLAKTIKQLQAVTKQTSSDIETIQNAGNQLHGEFQSMQQQLTAHQQQFEQFHAMMQQMQGSVDAIASNAAAAAPPPKQAEAMHPDLVPEKAPAQPPPEAPPPAPPAEQPAAAPPPAAAPAGNFVAAAMQDIDTHLAQAAGNGPADASLQAVAAALKGDVVDIYLDPVVTLPERKPAHYEVYGGVRGADGAPMAIDPNLDATGREQLMTAIENGLLARSLDRIAALDISGLEGGACFYNLAGVTLGDRGFFAGLVEHLKANPALAQRLVLECPQSALMEHGEQAVQDLVALQEIGCRFSIDGITDLEIDFESLAGFGFRYIKVGSKFMRVQANAADDPESVRGLTKALQEIGMEVIVEGVETDLSLVELIAFDIAFGQGPLFGQPAAA